MANHPNRGWRGRWTVNVEQSTATHKDGWAFKFDIVEKGGVDTFTCHCIGKPDPLTQEQLSNSDRIAREAWDIYRAKAMET
jgi:hypothetical protein